ncbi:MAG: glucose-6-phosphate isomerase [Chlamydiota bacterium]|nr:glucose-6-phosphate isomerase [Chlamydiota bacterium]
MATTEEEKGMDLEFTKLPAFEKLKRLSESPLDFSKDGVLTPERLLGYSTDSCGLKMLYGTERVDDEVLHALIELAKQANVIDKMHRMQSGEILNCIKGFPSENRAVLHTATRDFFEDKKRAMPAKEAAEMAKGELEKLKSFIEENDSTKKFTDLIMIGIGGSDLGPYANFLGLEFLKQHDKSLYFINNVDPDNAAQVLKQATLSKSLVVVVSKSGTTLETKVNADFVKARFIEAGLKPENHFVSVTGEGSPMDDPSQYLASFYIWDWIGGRYSSTSMVGGVLLAFAFGIDVFEEFLRGANAMDVAALNEDPSKNLPLLGALLAVWNHNFLNLPTLAVIPYSHALRRYPAHIQQLSMESNGKHVDKVGRHVDFSTGEIIWGEPGTNAQHSFYQLIHQGTDRLPLEFVGFKDSQYGEDYEYSDTNSQEKLLSNLFAQAIGLATGKKSDNPNKEFLGNRPSHIILGERLTPFVLGALLSYFENKVAFQGFIWNINSFDQEGVQLGKVLANKIIDRFASKNGGALSEEYPLADALMQHLEDF